MNHVIQKQLQRESNKLKVMKNLGRELSFLGLLPIVEESGNLRSSGNFSLRFKDGFFITASGVDKRNIDSDSIVFVPNIKNSIINIKSNKKPSRELFIHKSVYSTFSNINVVVHIHDLLVLKFGDKLRIPCTNNCIIGASKKESEEILYLLKKSPIINIKNHGQVIIGRDVEEVLELIIKFNKQAWKLNINS
ncbi:class II aldolase/adducin family protein [Candidatus Woesearchaeota archaeon]|nr:class II aldolase/adducin family protein [Candidatus Woesearchaeota archaeon]